MRTICCIIAFGLSMSIAEISSGGKLNELPFTDFGIIVLGITFLIAVFLDICSLIGWCINFVKDLKTPPKPEWYYYSDGIPYVSTMTTEETAKAIKAIRQLKKDGKWLNHER